MPYIITTLAEQALTMNWSPQHATAFKRKQRVQNFTTFNIEDTRRQRLRAEKLEQQRVYDELIRARQEKLTQNLQEQRQRKQDLLYSEQQCQNTSNANNQSTTKTTQGLAKCLEDAHQRYESMPEIPALDPLPPPPTTLEVPTTPVPPPATFRVHEMTPGLKNYQEWVRLYHDTDVLISGYGTGLLLGVMMPPGSVAIEINSFFAKDVGFNKFNNAVKDYGGNFHAMGVNHLHLRSPFFKGGNSLYSFSDVPPLAVSLGLRASRCALHNFPRGWEGRKESSMKIHARKINDRCWSSATHSTWRQYEFDWHGLDPGGSHFRLLARLNWPRVLKG